ncbi:MAG: 3'-5' exonuclease, partial [Gammaproteobacteria bacterium]
DIESIRNYCETDVLNTYLVYLRYELIRGRLTENQYQDECNQVQDLLNDDNKPHFKEFLNVWQKG